MYKGIAPNRARVVRVLSLTIFDSRRGFLCVLEGRERLCWRSKRQTTTISNSTNERASKQPKLRNYKSERGDHQVQAQDTKARGQPITIFKPFSFPPLPNSHQKTTNNYPGRKSAPCCHNHPPRSTAPVGATQMLH